MQTEQRETRKVWTRSRSQEVITDLGSRICDPIDRSVSLLPVSD